METVIMPILRFLGVFMLQVFVFNALEPGFGIHIMIYPLFIALLPFNNNVFSMLTISFFLGFIIDIFSNTFGLHSSAALAMAIARPPIYNNFSPRDGYDNLKLPTILRMGFRWHLVTFGPLLLIHHLWFFALESFRLDELFFTLKKTFLSAFITFIVCMILQYIFFKKEKSR
ncbi:MAG: hypothetical protein FJX84_04970 [Bacteroidetes bacterium]|nr:hypothetical protein [Bacteroidota bacterium]